MELLSNVIWLMVWAVPIAWWIRKRSFTSGRREFWLSIVTLLCVGMLLFAPISISDDLHQDVFAPVEDANSAKKMVVGGAHANALSPGALALAVVTALVGTFCPSQSYLISLFTPVLSFSLFVSLIPSRAPPLA
jgi:hypothetical protein